ncbi:MAG: 4-hydroxy-tetrahydrodipicolinate synthase [Bacteroidia bacterium]|nr:4-hydroxy-tetrahydrodipicolinate synthase [Bacteroidia bacterium]
MKEITGAGVALITPFKKDLSIDTVALKNLVENQCSNGTDFLVVLGTTGESPVFSESETRLIIDTVKEANNNRLPLVLGIGGNNTEAVNHKFKAIDLSGFSAVLSVSPYYNKPNQEGIYRHYVSLADNSPLPIILYNVPGRTGSNITAATTLRLAEHQNICAVKEASGNFAQCMEIIQNRPDGFLVISGDDAFTFPFISLGMDGVISVICNAFPKQFSQMVHAALTNNTVEARKLHYLLLDSMNLIFEDGSPGGIKEIMQYMGICNAALRPPLYPVNEKVREKLVYATDKVLGK